MFRMPESLVTNITFLSEPALSNAQATKHSTTLQSLCGIDKSHHWQCPGIFVTGHLAGLVERTGLVGVASTPFGVFSPNTTAHNSNTALLLNEKLHNIYILLLHCFVFNSIIFIIDICVYDITILYHVNCAVYISSIYLHFTNTWITKCHPILIYSHQSLCHLLHYIIYISDKHWAR